MSKLKDQTKCYILLTSAALHDENRLKLFSPLLCP